VKTIDVKVPIQIHRVPSGSYYWAESIGFDVCGDEAATPEEAVEKLMAAVREREKKFFAIYEDRPEIYQEPDLTKRRPS